MKKTQAIREARKLVSMPTGSRTSWALYGPYRASMPHGIRTESHFASYAQAAGRRKVWVASVALGLMGVSAEVDGSEGVTISSLVDYGVKNPCTY